MRLYDRKGIMNMKRSSIPTYLYTDRPAFLLLDKRKAQPLSSFVLPKGNKEDRHMSYDSRATKKQSRRRGTDTSRPYGMDLWFKLLLTPTDQGGWDSLGHKTRYHVASMANWGMSEEIRVMASDIHNDKGDPKIMGPLSKIMRKNKLKNPTDIAQFIVDRWKPMMPA